MLVPNMLRRMKHRIGTACTIASLCLATAIGCEQKMASQPSYRPLVGSRFFADGRASRPLVRGTVSRDASELDLPLISARKVNPAVAALPEPDDNATDSTREAAGIRPDDFATEFPIRITRELLYRGQERYTVYCAICHDAGGTGNGKIVQRGFTRPPSFVNDNSRQLARSGFQIALSAVPVGYLFDVATNGYGAMADYSSQVPARDRWAIAAYIRVLQRSQKMPLDALPPNLRNEAQKLLEATP